MADWDTWSCRANYWDGDRVLGGRLSIADEHVRFRPHAFERSLGGVTEFDADLRAIVAIEALPRGRDFPRRRLLLTVSDGRREIFGVPRLDRVIETLKAGVERAGGVLVPHAGGSTGIRAEARVEDSPILKRVYSGWRHLLALTVWLILLVALLVRSDRPLLIALVAAAAAMSALFAVRGFQRSARLRASHRRSQS